ncbi:MAG: rRNA pseudouridine synthase [Acholeplasmatales bacterium]|nr:MAG: rRNA pseudouridine synthase [Acholeplasmatales bacterium]
MDRLQKVIANSGLCSRRKAEEMMLAGRVAVNGETIKTLGYKVHKGDDITVDGKPLKHEEPEHYVLYKPTGCLSTAHDEHGRRTVLDYVRTDARIYPVGRLDYDSSGVLLLTNDGAFANLMMQPDSRIEKEYQLTVKGFLRRVTSERLERGIKLDGVKTRRARISQVTYLKESGNTQLSIVITEGKYRQVRRMFESVGHAVIRLKRVRYGIVTLQDLAKGDVRRLKPHEIKQLHQLATRTQHKPSSRR